MIHPNSAPTEFSTEDYLETITGMLSEVTKEDGRVSFSGMGEVYGDQLAGMNDEHVLIGMEAEEILEEKTGEKASFSRLNDIAEALAQVSRASAILEANNPAFTRLGKLEDSSRRAVIAAAIDLGLGQ